jgi:hypothetical protein
MRAILISLVIAAAAGSAAAQSSSPYQSGYTSSTTAVGSLPPEGRSWVLEETARQSVDPGKLSDLDAALEEAIGEDLAPAAKHLRTGRKDLMAAIRFEIVREARRMADRDIKDHKKAVADEPTDDAMLGLQAAQTRRIRLGALEAQASNRLTGKARELVGD